MRYLIMLEQTDVGFAVQVPDLAIVTHGETIEAAKQVARKRSGSMWKRIGKLAKRSPSVNRLSTIWRIPHFKNWSLPT